MISAILADNLKDIETRKDPHFRPRRAGRLPLTSRARSSDPRRTWLDTAAYDRKAGELARTFVRNFEENAADAPPEIAAAGPTS